MSYPTVKELVEQYGYSKEEAEREVQLANCKHDFGDMCQVAPFGGGCVRTCVKCGQMQGLGRHCWEKKK